MYVHPTDSLYHLKWNLFAKHKVDRHLLYVQCIKGPKLMSHFFILNHMQDFPQLVNPDYKIGHVYYFR